VYQQLDVFFQIISNLSQEYKEISWAPNNLNSVDPSISYFLSGMKEEVCNARSNSGRSNSGAETVTEENKTGEPVSTSQPSQAKEVSSNNVCDQLTPNSVRAENLGFSDCQNHNQCINWGLHTLQRLTDRLSSLVPRQAAETGRKRRHSKKGGRKNRKGKNTRREGRKKNGRKARKGRKNRKNRKNKLRRMRERRMNRKNKDAQNVEKANEVINNADEPDSLRKT
jgi:hypothetical protein